ncbi:hypothetical protein EJ08DRAFT_426080 [Tothia fuscella]|uniref:Uncharacterized protein n=1 Tax=Tothia fuscella TaxID=1048955 RepID=A0A9P4NZT3_9PEZI|nr:hypothetical protein EJ08DRAFT_426080 [Tothia fuscella]
MATPSSPSIPTISLLPKGPLPTALAPGPGIQPTAQNPQIGAAITQVGSSPPGAAPLGNPAGPPPNGVPAGPPPNGAPAAGAQGAAPPVTGAIPQGVAGAHGPPDMRHINPYVYTPSFGMAIVGASAFLISSGFHIHQMFKYKSWYFNLMTQAVLMSSVSMIARTHSIMTLRDTGATGPFVIFMIMDMIGPSLAVIGNIFTLTRVIWWVTPNERRNFKTLCAPPHAISMMWAVLFSIPDIAKSVGQQAFKPQDPTGLKIQEIGQVLQFFALLGFFIFALRFMRMSKRWLVHGAAEEKQWRKLGWTTVAVAGLTLARSVFAVVAHDARADPKSFYAQHEFMYWITQAIPLFVVYALYNFYFPGEFLPREYTGFRLKLKEIEKAKLETPWPLSISSPIRRSVDKGVEITLTEMENGRGGRSDISDDRNYRR